MRPFSPPGPAPGPLGTAPLPRDRARWHELLAALDADTLAETFLRRVRSVDGYREPPLPISRIHDDAVESFARLIEALRTGDRTPTEEIALRVGSSRARAGVPLTSLMAAIQLDFSMLWGELCAHGRADDAELLLRHTTTVWHVVEDYVRQTERAYLAERSRMSEESASVRRGLIAELLGDTAPSGTRLVELAELLELDPAGRFAVAVAHGEAVAELRIEIANLERADRQTLALYHHGGLVLVVPLHPGDSLEPLRRLPLGLVERVEGLARVAAAARLAAELGVLAETGAHPESVGAAAVTPAPAGLDSCAGGCPISSCSASSTSRGRSPSAAPSSARISSRRSTPTSAPAARRRRRPSSTATETP